MQSQAEGPQNWLHSIGRGVLEHQFLRELSKGPGLVHFLTLCWLRASGRGRFLNTSGHLHAGVLQWPEGSPLKMSLRLGEWGIQTGARRNSKTQTLSSIVSVTATATAKSLQSCPTLCDPIDGSPPAFPVPGILKARTQEWVAISFSNVWKWKVTVKSLSRVWLEQPDELQPTRFLRPWDFPGKSTGVGCHCLLRVSHSVVSNSLWPHAL